MRNRTGGRGGRAGSFYVGRAAQRGIERLEGRVLLAADTGVDPQCPAQVAVGDVTGDGVPDLVTLNVEAVREKTTRKSGSIVYRGTFDVQAGRRDGSFGQINPVRNSVRALDGNPVAIAVGDLDGDGLADVAVACDATDAKTGAPNVTVQMYLNDGKGDFGSGGAKTRRTWVVPHVLERSGALAIGDVDGDGRADVCVGGVGLSVVGGLVPGGAILSNALGKPNGDGTGGAPVERTFVIPHILEKAGVTAEFNEVRGLAGGHFQSGDVPTQEQFALWDDATATAVIVSMGKDGQVALAGVTHNVKSPRDAASGLATGRFVGAGDVNRDGWDDLVAIADGKDGIELAVGLNQGSGGKELKFEWTSTPVPEAPSSMKVKEKGNRTKCGNNLRTFLTNVDLDGGVDVMLLDPRGSDSADVYVVGVTAYPGTHAVSVTKPYKTGHVTLMK